MGQRARSGVPSRGDVVKVHVLFYKLTELLRQEINWVDFSASSVWIPRLSFRLRRELCVDDVSVAECSVIQRLVE